MLPVTSSTLSKPRLTLVHPCVGRHRNESYIRSWQMEPLAPALLSALTPAHYQVSFYDDRTEPIRHDVPTDLVAISVETYTARRAYQIASEYRRRGVPVVMGGFHPTLVPDEVGEFAEAVVVGEAETLWPQLLEDFENGRLQRLYKAPTGRHRHKLQASSPNRDLYRGKRYLPIRLVEAGRGCHFSCRFCAIASFFSSTQLRRPAAEIMAELQGMRNNVIFFVDDNVTSRMEEAKELFRMMAPLKLRWIGQASITAAWDEEFLQLLKASGCQGLLVGFESLDPSVLGTMGKSFNVARGGYAEAIAQFRKYGIRLYGTFIIGYDGDSRSTVERALNFALDQQFFLAAFNHLTPFPNTPLYHELEADGRLLYPRWWMANEYRYGEVPFRPIGLDAPTIQRLCHWARRRFYGTSGLMQRARAWEWNLRSPFMTWQFFAINKLMGRDVSARDGLPLGDAGWEGKLLSV